MPAFSLYSTNTIPFNTLTAFTAGLCSAWKAAVTMTFGDQPFPNNFILSKPIPGTPDLREMT
jgi:hypothetical protein